MLLPGKPGTYSAVPCPWPIGVGYTVVGLGVVFPFSLIRIMSRKNFFPVSFKKAQTLSVVDKADPVKPQIGILELGVLN